MDHNAVYVKRSYSIIYYVAIALIVLYTLIFTDFFAPGINKRVLDFSEGWTIPTGEELSIYQIKKRRYKEAVTMQKKLPLDIKDTDSFCLQSKNINFVVWIDNKEVYRFETKDNITGCGYGFTTHEIGLDHNMEGDIIRINYDGVITGYKGGGVIEAIICSGSDYIRMTTMNNLFLISSSLMVLIIGAILIILWIVIPNRAMFPFDILAFGTMACVLGLWSTIDTGLPSLFSGHFYASRIITRFLFPMVFYPFFVFLHSFTEKKRPIYRHVAFWATLLFNPILIFLRYAAGIDMIYSYAYVFSVFGVILVFSIVIMIIDDIYTCISAGKKSKLQDLVFGFMFIVVSAVAEGVSYFLRLNPLGKYFVYLRLGIFAFIICVFILFLRWWIVDRSLVERDQIVNRAVHFSLSSDSSQESINRLLEFIGVQFQIRRICLFENAKDGTYKETYEWCQNNLDRHRTQSLIIPSVVLKEKTDDKHHCMTISSRSQCEQTFPKIAQAMKQADIDSIISRKLDLDDSMSGVLELHDLPIDRLSEIEEIVDALSYYFIQFSNHQKNQDDILYYSYHDELTGSKNRICYRDYTERQLDLSQPFGYLIFKADGLDRVIENPTFKSSDEILKNLARKLMDVFGENNVYRVEENAFAAFGFETDETFFRNDVARAKLEIMDGQCKYRFGALYCANGTRSMDVISKKAIELMGD